jgi:hypothetical protein
MTVRQSLQDQVGPLRMAQVRSNRLLARALVLFAVGRIVALLWASGGFIVMVPALFIAFRAFHLRFLGSVAKRSTIVCPVCSKSLGYLFIDRDYIHQSAFLRIPGDVPESIAACPYCGTGMDEPLDVGQLSTTRIAPVSTQSTSAIRETRPPSWSVSADPPVSRAILALRAVGTVLLVGAVVTVTFTPTSVVLGGGILSSAAKLSVAAGSKEVYLTSAFFGFIVSLGATCMSIRSVGSAARFRWSLLWAVMGIASLLNEGTRLSHDHIRILFCFPLLQVIADWRLVRFLKTTEAQRTAQETGCLAQETTEAEDV